MCAGLIKYYGIRAFESLKKVAAFDYHGILLDEDGLPEINDKEAIAIAEYIAYVYKYKEAIRTNN